MVPRIIVQHYVPQSYLRLFADDDERVTVYDKYASKSFQASFRNVAAEREFNDYSATLDPTDVQNFQAVEKGLSDIEEKGATLLKGIRKLVEQDGAKSATIRIPRNYWRNLCSWTALQYMRTKQSREMLRQAYSELGNALMRATAPDVAPDIDVDSLSLTYSEDYIKWRHLNHVFEYFGEFAENLERKVMQIWFNRTAVPFWASDHPVVMDELSERYRIGVLEPKRRILYPLTPKLAAVFIDPAGYPHLRGSHCQIRKVSRDDVHALNRLQVVDSHRFVFSSAPDMHRAQLVTSELGTKKASKANQRLSDDTKKVAVADIVRDIKGVDYDALLASLRRRGISIEQRSTEGEQDDDANQSQASHAFAQF